MANANLYVGLYAGTINDSHTATSTGECGGSTYARVAVANSSANWTNAAAGSKQNKTVITITTAAGSDWGTITAWAILDTTSTSTGRMLFSSTLTNGAQVINNGNVVQFSTGSIVLTVT